MVQKYQSPVRVYKYPFEFIMAAYERRFPQSDLIPIFLGSEITSEENSEDGATQVIERRCRLDIAMPYFLKKIANVDEVIFIQTNSLDRKARTLNIEAYNESFNNRLNITESCIYSVHPENPEWTTFEQVASLDIKSLFGFENVVEKIAIKQYTDSIKKGKEVMEYFIQEVLDEGVTYIPPWRPPSRTESTDGAGPKQLKDKDVSAKKLEVEYIHKCLGDLSLSEESQLVQIRRILEESHKGKMPKDAHILRFLQARDFHIDRTLHMLNRSLAWRKRYNVDNITKDYEPPAVIGQYFCGGWCGSDADGRPVYVLRLGQMDVKGLMKSVGEELLLKHILVTIESGIKHCEHATTRLHRPITRCVCLVDLEGLSMRHLWRPGVRAFMRIIETVQSNYPEFMHQLLMVRAPRVFPVLWTLICPFIDENTSKKFLVYGGRDYQKRLVEFLPKEAIPDWLGGEQVCCIPLGGLVPKSLYRTEEDENSISTIYLTAYIIKDFNHEIALNVPNKGCVITWDFDVLKGETVFTLVRCRHQTLRLEPHEHHMGGAVISTQYVPKHWTLGPDLIVCEPAVLCQEGDSVQGSHVCMTAGVYILQWRHYSSQTIFAHKSKIMYFVEVIQSENFRGSMSSIRSANSAFSQMSSCLNSPREAGTQIDEDLHEESLEGLNRCSVDRFVDGGKAQVVEEQEESPRSPRPRRSSIKNCCSSMKNCCKKKEAN